MTVEQELRARLRENPDDDASRLRLAVLLEDRSRPRQAARQYYYLAAAARLRNDEEALAEALQDVLRLDPDYLVLFTEAPRKRRRTAGPDSPHVLVAHDETSVRESLVPLLGSWGYHVQGIGDEAEALKALEQPLELLITGTRLGERTGHELARLARELHPSTAIVMLTAAFRPEALPDKPDARAAVVDEYLERPFAPQVFRETVEACLWRSQHAASVPEATVAEADGDTTEIIRTSELKRVLETEPPDADPKPPGEPEPVLTPSAPAEIPAPDQSVYAGLRVAVPVVALGLLLILVGHFYFGPSARLQTPPDPAATPLEPMATPPVWEAPPTPGALYPSRSRSEQDGPLRLDATVLSPRLLMSTGYHSALADGVSQPEARATAESRLPAYDFERSVYVQIALSVSEGSGLDPEVIFRGLRLDAPGIQSQAAAPTPPLFPPRIVRRANPEGGTSIRYLGFVAAFPREPFGETPIVRLYTGDGTRRITLSLPYSH